MKVAVICNSSNAFFLNYYSSLLENVNDERILFLGNRVFKNKGNNTFKTISYTKNAFLDFYSIFDLFLSFFVAIYLKTQKVSIIHFVSAHSSNIFLSFFAKILNIKIAFTIHDLIPHPDKKSSFVDLYNKSIRSFFGNYFVVHNREYEEAFEKDVFYIPLSGYKSDSLPRNLPKTILFFGRIEPYKGIKNLYALGELFLKEKMDWNIIIAGKGKLPLYDKPIPSNIEIINDFISDELLRSLHLKSAFTILPYDSASQSAVIIHAYAYGTPVIVYDVGSLGEYVIQKETGIIVKHNDYNAILKYLKEITVNDYKKLQLNIANHFSETYSDKAFAKDSIQLYEKWLS